MNTPNPSRGRLIVLEGGEGAGKTTQARLVEQWLRSRGRQVVRTREPGGSPLAEAVRELVLRRWDEGMDPATEALLMFAARAAHLNSLLRPGLEQGRDVVCDRFVDASYAYQGAGRGLGAERIAALEGFTLGDLRADLVLVLDLEPSQGLARARRRGDENRFEAETLAFMRRVREAYLHRAQADPARYAVIDAGQPVEQVGEAVRQILEQRL
jgi:dTMP kinase